MADEVLTVCEHVGLFLDEWQQLVIRGAHGIRPDGSLSAPEVGVCVPRQNGKGGILEAVELGRLFVLGSPLTLHSAHQFDTSLEAYKRLRDLIEGTPIFDKQVRRYPSAHGSEGIELRSGPRIRFRTRTKGGGRGFSGDCVILDEAMYLPETVIAALLPVISAKQYGQIWYTGSAVDQASMEDGLAFARVRERGLAGAEWLAWYEWSVALANPDDVTEELALDPWQWAISNPAFGIRIMSETFRREFESMGIRSYAVERLNVGDWPSVTGGSTVVDMDRWGTLADRSSQPNDPLCFAYDVSPNREWSSIGVAGRRSDRDFHVEVVERKRGTSWLPEYLAERAKRHKAVAVVCDGRGPAASLIPALERAGVKVDAVTAAEHARACGLFYDGVMYPEATLGEKKPSRVRHLGQPELDAALRGAAQRPLGDAWAWSRKTSAVDITSLVACTLAMGGLVAREKRTYRTVGF